MCFRRKGLNKFFNKKNYNFAFFNYLFEIFFFNFMLIYSIDEHTHILDEAIE